jgi:hypothetical protein
MHVMNRMLVSLCREAGVVVQGRGVSNALGALFLKPRLQAFLLLYLEARGILSDAFRMQMAV